MRSGDWRVDVQVLRLLSRTPGAIRVLIIKQELHATMNGSLELFSSRRDEFCRISSEDGDRAEQGNEQERALHQPCSGFLSNTLSPSLTPSVISITESSESP